MEFITLFLEDFGVGEVIQVIWDIVKICVLLIYYRIGVYSVFVHLLILACVITLGYYFSIIFFYNVDKKIIWNFFMWIFFFIAFSGLPFFYWFSDKRSLSVLKEYLLRTIKASEYFGLSSFFLDFFSFSFTFEAVSRFLIILTFFIFFFAILISLKHVEYGLKFYCLLLVLLQSLLFFIFCVSNLSFFYILFEFILLPVFLLIGMWGFS